MTILPVPVEHVIALAGLLMALGIFTVVWRRNLLFMLLGIEVMFNAAGLAFIVAGARWGQADGQVMFILNLTLAAVEGAVGLAVILQLDRRFNSLDADAPSRMRG